MSLSLEAIALAVIAVVLFWAKLKGVGLMPLTYASINFLSAGVELEPDPNEPEPAPEPEPDAPLDAGSDEPEPEPEPESEK